MIAGLWWVLGAHAAPPAQAQVYTLPLSDDEVDDLKDRVVDEASRQFGLLTRGIARQRLGKLFTACRHVTAWLDGEQYMVQCKGREPLMWRVGQTGPYVDHEGRKLTLTVTHQPDDTMVLEFQGPDGGKRFVHDYTSGGLTITQSVWSPALKQPMTWSLTYETSN